MPFPKVQARVSVRVPGKIILAGEHAVVYGKLALVAATDTYVTVTAHVDSVTDSGRCTVTDAEDKRETTTADVMKKARELRALWQAGELYALSTQLRQAFLSTAVGCVLEQLDVPESTSVRVDVDSAIPKGSGMGSSAAIAVGIARALSTAIGRWSSLKEVNRAAYDIECLAHGRPSGVDNTACCYGGIHAHSPPNTEKLLGSRMPPCLLVNVGAPTRTTSQLIEFVRELDSTHRDRCVDVIDDCARSMRLALACEHTYTIHATVNRVQDELFSLGVSTPEIDAVVKCVRKAGGAAKLCGAGGGGVVMCLHDDLPLLERTLRSRGHHPTAARLGVAGLTITSATP